MKNPYKILLLILLMPMLSFGQTRDKLTILDKLIKKQLGENHPDLIWSKDVKSLTEKVNLKIKSTNKKIAIPNNHTDTVIFYNGNDELLYSKDELTIQFANYSFTRNGKKTTASLFVEGPRSVSQRQDGRVTKIINLNPQKAEKLLDKLIKLGVCILPDDTKHGFDGRQYVVKVATPTKYRQYSYWSPDYTDGKNAVQLLDILSTLTDSFNGEEETLKIYENVPFGEYSIGMNIGMIADGFLPDSAYKSTAYKRVEKLMKEKMDFNDVGRFQFPLITIDDKECLMQELNRYTAGQLANISIKPGKKAPKKYIISDRTYFGEVKITLKNKFTSN